MKHVLVGVDGSVPAQHALGFATKIAAQFKAKLSIAYVMAPSLVASNFTGFSVNELQREERTWAEGMLKDSKAGALQQGVPEVETAVIEGKPAEAIADAALTGGVDLVVVGSHGRGAVARVLIGSVSDRLVHICPRPVLIVR